MYQLYKKLMLKSAYGLGFTFGYMQAWFEEIVHPARPVKVDPKQVKDWSEL